MSRKVRDIDAEGQKRPRASGRQIFMQASAAEIELQAAHDPMSSSQLHLGFLLSPLISSSWFISLFLSFWLWSWSMVIVLGCLTGMRTSFLGHLAG